MSYWAVIDHQFDGNLAKFGRAMGVSRQLAYAWRRQGYIPAKRALATERVTEGRVPARLVVEVAAERGG